MEKLSKKHPTNIAGLRDSSQILSRTRVNFRELHWKRRTLMREIRQISFWVVLVWVSIATASTSAQTTLPISEDQLLYEFIGGSSIAAHAGSE